MAILKSFDSEYSLALANATASANEAVFTFSSLGVFSCQITFRSGKYVMSWAIPLLINDIMKMIVAINFFINDDLK